MRLLSSTSSPLRPRGRLGRFTIPYRGLALIGSYGAWVLLFRLLVLTFVTYFVVHGSATGHGSRFEEVSEAFASNEITLMGLCALLFVLFLRGLYPLSSTTFEEIVSVERIEKSFLPGFLHGTVLGMGVILAFLISGIYRYLGLFIQFDEASLAIPSILVRIVGIGVWVYFEEFIFRRKIARHFASYSPLFTIFFTAIVYCVVKAIQFEIGWMQILTLFLASVALSLRGFAEADFARGAGFWAALLIVFHPLLSLPIFGNEFSGVFLVKYQGAPDIGNAASTTLARLLTGGAGGPLSSFAFQFVLLLEILRGALKYRQRYPSAHSGIFRAP